MLQWTETAQQTTADRAWRRFVASFLAVFVGGLAAIYAFILLVDPYDTGRFPALPLSGVAEPYKATANVSRARDPQFNAAVIGNSHGQLLDPARLSHATGLSVVQLTTPGSGPREQLATMRWFLRHHPDAAAIIITIDNRWCGQDPRIPVTYPFPFWLYRGDLEYLANVLSTRSLGAASKRLMLQFGRGVAANRDGASDYEAGRAWNFHPGIPERFAAAATSAAGPVLDLPYPALERLMSAAAGLSPSTRLVLVMPPVFYTALPGAGSRSAAELASCKAVFARWTGQRPGSVFLDFLVDTPMSRDPHNFMDTEHYRSAFAREIERRIAAALAGTVMRPEANARREQ
ncbi:MAG TPA: hypothetical protein VHA77_06295 [Xanthobacteraceae bacterium]|nr:hypothetical protein [Xanthobacteraceae bacterium]